MNKISFYLSLFILLITGAAKANVLLPSFFSDNMVLQRNSEVTIWGWASPFEDVTLTVGWSKEEIKIKPDNQAHWEVKLKTPEAGGPYTLHFKGYNELTIKNIMIGEVWFCSGQSNMEWSASIGIDNAEAEIAKANYPNIRFFTAPKVAGTSPQMNIVGNWQECTPETMKYFSAVAYFFGERLQKDLKDVPIGLINSSWGGTPAEIWMPEDYIAKDAVLAEAAAKLTPVAWGPTEPGRTYNTMINPFVGLKLAGAIWYQGESNVGSTVYDKTLAGLIKSWREAWGDDFPFYFIQIAPFNYENDTYGGVIIRNSQRKVLNEVPKTGMVVVGDVSPTDDIHPRDKRTVGERLGNLVLKSQYGIDTGVVNGPLYKDITISKNKVTIRFDYAEGLHFSSKKSELFEVAGKDGTFYPATATIKNNTVVVSSKKVKEPVTVRYAWHNTAKPDLFNGAGLPASSFLSE